MSRYAPRRGRPAKLLRKILLPTIGVAFALGAVSVVSGILAKPASAVSKAAAPQHMLQPRLVVSPAASHGEKAARLAAMTPAKQDRHWIEALKPDATFAADAGLRNRFEHVVASASLSPHKLAAILADAGMEIAPAPTRTAHAQPLAERFDHRPMITPMTGAMALAYADPSPAAGGALAALSNVAPDADAALAIEPDEASDADGTALSPDYEDTPDDTPLPLRRPKVGSAAEERGIVEERADDKPAAERPAAPEKPSRQARQDSGRGGEQKLAYARPDDPSGKSGGFLKNLFNRPRAGNGVAVYDISAARVYMPDGSVLEAHSGIGKMADNPRYTHVKMNGPTPAHTYNLKMREKRFHGVEAIRMLPVDGKNKHGRDGFLTHSYLLRGGRAESHGCVAFKDYKRFLNAFKQGKVKQLVVVPGGGKAIMVAKNGRDA